MVLRAKAARLQPRLERLCARRCRVEEKFEGAQDDQNEGCAG